ncbi:MAG: hypothetical protein J6P62_05610 [Bacteroidales bacterium]|nr:hypothetical protein [Bacteroidales bacterium]
MNDSALSTAGTGAAIGSMFGPWGALIGGVGGLAVGGLMDESANDKQHMAIESALGSLDGARGVIDSAYGQNNMLANQGLGLAGSLWDPNGTLSAKYSKGLSDMENMEGYNADNLFQYDKSIQDFYDPAFKLSVDMANDSINSSQAFGGNMFSSDTANKLAAKNNVLATQMYNDAADAMNADKMLEQSIWAGNESAKQAAADSDRQIAQMLMDSYGTGMSNLSSAQQGYIANKMGLNSDYAADITDYLGTKAVLQAQDPGTKEWYEKLLDPAGLFG